MNISHDELSSAGLSHGTGAACCGCPECRCVNCYLKRVAKSKVKGGRHDV